jgi:hypothetical protein
MGGGVDSSAKLSGGEGYNSRMLEEAPISFILFSFTRFWTKSGSSADE